MSLSCCCYSLPVRSHPVPPIVRQLAIFLYMTNSRELFNDITSINPNSIGHTFLFFFSSSTWADEVSTLRTLHGTVSTQMILINGDHGEEKNLNLVRIFRPQNILGQIGSTDWWWSGWSIWYQKLRIMRRPTHKTKRDNQEHLFEYLLVCFP